jgi:hypothetical protein
MIPKGKINKDTSIPYNEVIRTLKSPAFLDIVSKVRMFPFNCLFSFSTRVKHGKI